MKLLTEADRFDAIADTLAKPDEANKLRAAAARLRREHEEKRERARRKRWALRALRRSR